MMSIDLHVRYLPLARNLTSEQLRVVLYHTPPINNNLETGYRTCSLRRKP